MLNDNSRKIPLKNNDSVYLAFIRKYIYINWIADVHKNLSSFIRRKSCCSFWLGLRWVMLLGCTLLKITRSPT
ncbi:hypothetical protein DPEC_G00110690 [Dallia pectoralis]|uniref:Uncharacterized protein n=1 Tax=Dallia pectoralis TaxID=75939 RepID=A0ACC2GT92_DALPE|nr:hypothetical protein DPEC_G00110690 [Dallia pectoralis]